MAGERKVGGGLTGLDSVDRVEGLRSGLESFVSSLSPGGRAGGVKAKRAMRAGERAETAAIRADRAGEIKAGRLERQEQFLNELANSPIVQGMKYYTLTQDKEGTLERFNRNRKEGDKWTDFSETNGNITAKDAKGGVVKVPVANYINGIYASSSVDAIRNIVGGGSSLTESQRLAREREQRIVDAAKKKEDTRLSERDEEIGRREREKAEAKAEKLETAKTALKAKVRASVDKNLEKLGGLYRSGEFQGPKSAQATSVEKQIIKAATNEQEVVDLTSEMTASLEGAIADAETDLEKDERALLRRTRTLQKGFPSDRKKVDDDDKLDLLTLEEDIEAKKDNVAATKSNVTRLKQRLRAIRKQAQLTIEELTPEAQSGGRFGNRQDGTPKGNGFLGALPVKGGGVATEYTIGIEIDGEETDIPTLVPTLTKAEVKQMTDDIIPNKKRVPRGIMEKAVAHAKSRLANGQSVFADKSEEHRISNEPVPLPATAKERDALPAGTLVRDPATGRVMRKK